MRLSKVANFVETASENGSSGAGRRKGAGSCSVVIEFQLYRAEGYFLGICCTTTYTWLAILYHIVRNGYRIFCYSWVRIQHTKTKYISTRTHLSTWGGGDVQSTCVCTPMCMGSFPWREDLAMVCHALK